MARYIDADKLLEELNEELMYESTMFSKEQEDYLQKGIRIAIGDVKRFPTADVVPRSEYDRLKKLFKDMTQEAKGYLNRIYGITADVAREIFEEIDELIFQHGRGDLSDKYFYLEMDKLKKKYTEGDKDDNQN